MRLRILEGLPPYGEPALSFSETGFGKHREGVVVEFQLDDSSSWVGNFVPGLGKLDLAVPHPDKRNALVVSGGQAYVVDPVLRRVLKTFGCALNDFWHDEARASFVFESSGIDFIAVNRDGLLWRSRRVSWDGFRSLVLREDVLSGEAWCLDGSWHPFQLELASGRTTGGAYNERNDAST